MLPVDDKLRADFEAAARAAWDKLDERTIPKALIRQVQAMLTVYRASIPLMWGPCPRCTPLVTVWASQMRPDRGVAIGNRVSAGVRRRSARGLLGAELDSYVERCPTGTFARAEQLIAEARYREAIRFCQQQLAASPRCVTLRLWLARAFLADGAGAKGVAELEECLRIDPTCDGGARDAAGARRGGAVVAAAEVAARSGRAAERRAAAVVAEPRRRRSVPPPVQPRSRRKWRRRRRRRRTATAAPLDRTAPPRASAAAPVRRAAAPRCTRSRSRDCTRSAPPARERSARADGSARARERQSPAVDGRAARA